MAKILTNGIGRILDIETQKIKDDNLTLMRYLSLDKFLHALITDKFYFPCLEELSDGSEGDLNKVGKILFEGKSNPFSKLNPEKAKKNFRVLCFYGANKECDLMWRAYCPNGGVSIVTTVSKITKYLTTNKDSVLLRVAYEGALTHKLKNFHPIAFKANEFSAEYEVRIIQGTVGTNLLDSLKNDTWDKNDEYININWSFLEKIIISPNSKETTKKMIEEAINKKTPKIKAKIEESTIRRI